MEDIKNKLISTNYFEDNIYLNKYIELINNNIDTEKQPFKTQVHHIFPKSYFKLINEKTDESKDNKINLLYKDHILAHYYLALCTKDELKYDQIIAIRFIIGKSKQIKQPINLDFTLLENYQELYEESKQYFGNKRKGTTHITSEETKRKISLSNSGKVYINKNGKAKAIHPSELEYYLQNGWLKGNIKNKNCGIKKGTRTVVHKGNEQKYVYYDEVEKYLNDGWELGRSEEHCLKVSKTNINKNKNLTEKERKEFYGKGNIGSIWITNGIEIKHIKKEEINLYLEKGWSKGRKVGK